MIITDYINTDPFLLFFGCFNLVLGLSVFFARKHWEDFFDLIIEHDALSLVIGVVVLPVSLFIIVFYDNWASLGSIVLMVIGYMAFLKALVLLLRPVWIQNFLKKEFVRKWMWLDGMSGIALGCAILLL